MDIKSDSASLSPTNTGILSNFSKKQNAGASLHTRSSSQVYNKVTRETIQRHRNMKLTSSQLWRNNVTTDGTTPAALQM